MKEDKASSHEFKPIIFGREGVPAYGLPVHIPREGEPERDEVLDIHEYFVRERKMVGREHEALSKRMETWHYWLRDQPDRNLFVLEDSLKITWHEKNGQVTAEDFSPIYAEIEKNIHQLRAKGYGDLISHYWPHFEIMFPSK